MQIIRNRKKTLSVGMKLLREKKRVKSNGLSSFQGTRKGREARKPWVFQAGSARARDDGTDTSSTQLSTQVKDKRHLTQIHGQKILYCFEKVSLQLIL